MNNLLDLEAKIRVETNKHTGKPLALSGGIDSSLLAALVHPEFVISVELPSDTHNEIKYSKLVADYLGIRQVIVKPDDSKFDEYFAEAVKAIGRPIPHFNIFPLYCMYKTLSEMGVKELILGDGPDETMCGYARNLIMNYLYGIFEFEAFTGYHGLIQQVLLPPNEAYAAMTGKSLEAVTECFIKEPTLVRGMNRVDIDLMRPDMDDMSNSIAAHFGIKNIRPYQDNPELDNYMLNQPVETKISPDGLYGKVNLRDVAAKYLPKEIAYRLVKVGGPVYPVNVIKGWMDRGEFDKTRYLEEQEKILNG